MGVHRNDKRLLSVVLIAIVWLPTACRPVPVADHSHTTMLLDDVAVPQHVRRLAVWYPRTWEQELSYGYSRLEQAAFQLKKRRAGIINLGGREPGYTTGEDR